MIELYLWEVLFPELAVGKERLKLIETKIKDLLEGADVDSRGWIEVEKLVLAVQSTYSDMRCYYIYSFGKYFSLSVESEMDRTKFWVVDRLRLES